MTSEFFPQTHLCGVIDASMTSHLPASGYVVLWSYKVQRSHHIYLQHEAHYSLHPHNIMSDFTMNTGSTASRPQHHVHDTSDPLPGVGGAPAPADYSAGVMERIPSSVLNDTQTLDTNEVDSTVQPSIPRTQSASGQTDASLESPTSEQPTSGSSFVFIIAHPDVYR